MESEAIVFDSQATAAEFETETLVDLITASGTEQGKYFCEHMYSLIAC